MAFKPIFFTNFGFLKSNIKDLEIFKNFRFSICHLTKNEMKEIALKNNFFYILNITWSCWYPTKEGQPCGKCQMCIKRIIK